MTQENYAQAGEPSSAAAREEHEQDDFKDFGLKEAVLKGVDAAGFKIASPIQKLAIPAVLEGGDLIGQAHTGTGKTAAFGLPALNKLKNDGSVEVVVLTPTRELANQVSEEIYRLGRFLGVRTIPIYGGQPYKRQIESLRRGVAIVVATPGRLLDLLQTERIRENVRPWMVVIDEADEMLDMGFIEDVRKILELLPEERQTLLFSATMPRPVQALAEQFMKSPQLIRAGSREATSKDIQQQYYIIDEHERDDATVRLIDSLEPSRAMIFCRTKSEVDRLAATLSARGVLAQALHGDMEQPMRERVLQSFRNGDFQVLVATDMAARGIDVPEVSHVFNYHIPFDPDSYVHRIGRTGRAGRKGIAVTLVTPQEYQGLRRIQSKVGRSMQLHKVPTHKELKKAAEHKLLESVRTQTIDDETERFVMALEDDLGLVEAARKMAALLLSKEEVTGPDRIGVSGARLERLQEGPKRTPGKTTGKYKGFSSRPGTYKKRGEEYAGGYGARKRTGEESGGGYGAKKRGEESGGGYGARKRGEEYGGGYGFKKRTAEKRYEPAGKKRSSRTERFESPFKKTKRAAKKGK